jgi:hypothetical protein
MYQLNQVGVVISKCLTRDDGHPLKFDDHACLLPITPAAFVDGTLLLLFEALDLLSSLTEEATDILDILQRCSSNCRNAKVVAEQSPDALIRGFPNLTVKLQQYPHTVVSSLLTKSR